MKKLVIAEKPSVARDYAAALGASKFGNYYENSKYVITCAIGHLFRLQDPEEYDERYKKWKLQDLPIIPNGAKIKLYSHGRDQFNLIKSLMDRSDVSGVIVATDAGREGELIGRYILAGAGCKKPMQRVWLSSLSEKEIVQGFKKPSPLEDYDCIFDAAHARAWCDWLLGINLTRGYSLTEGNGKTIHVGRCQTPVLYLIYKRDIEVENFNSEDFWEVEAEFATGEYNYYGNWFRKADGSTRIENKAEALHLVTKLDGKAGTIDEVKKEIKRLPPPLLHDLTSLQRTMNRKYGFSAQKTLEIAQSLYETHKILSYPRTSSRYLSSEKAKELPDLVKNLQFDQYERYAAPLAKSRKLPTTKHMVDDEKLSDHHAIIPVPNSNISTIYRSLNDAERKVFDEIVYTFLAGFYGDYVYESTKVITRIENEFFKSYGIKPVEMGWRWVYNGEIDDEDSERELPPVVKGQTVYVEDLMIVDYKTTPPSRYTENTLLHVMENPTGISEDEIRKAIRGKGIGTVATRAELIENLIKRGYVARQGKYLVSTPLGRDLVNIIDVELLKSLELTAEWEYNLGKIENGELDKNRFMAEVTGFIKNTIKVIAQD